MNYRTFIASTLLVSAAVAGIAQNLVPNFSFEDISACPVFIGLPTIRNAPPWFNPTIGTSDLFHPCGSPNLNAPNNIVGYQQASSGVAYAGFTAFYGSGFSYREYIETPLMDTLEKDGLYCAFFKVSLTDLVYNPVDRIGLVFSADSIIRRYSSLATDFDTLAYEPDIESTPGVLLDDQQDWMLISGIYRATGYEKFITIGNFRTDNQTLSVDSLNVSYYYIDDVGVHAMTPITTVDPAGESDTLCIEKGGSVQLGRLPESGALYSWWPAEGLDDSTAAQPSAAPGHTTTYYLRLEKGSTAYPCTLSDTDSVTVYVIPCDTNTVEPVPNSAFLPNIFSPNGDGLNDTWGILGQNIGSVELRVFDRPGECVFTTSDPSAAWDGSFHGQPLNSGVFVYRCHVVYKDGSSDDLKGNITLLR